MPNPAAPPRRVLLLTLGCKLNQADSEAIAGELAARGCQVTDRPAAADAVVINTCSVTHVADGKSRHLVRLARRLAPGAPVVLTGCYAETAGPEAARAVGADVVVANRDKAALVERLLGAAQAPPVRPAAGLRTRAFVKVQEGCNDVCAFCIVPRTRGRERSRPLAEIVADVRQREERGAKEVVLTGTQLGAYGSDGSTPPLAEMLATVLAETGVPRIRVSSLQPRDISPDLLRLWADRRLCRHFHLALQSGSNAVLARMRRRYDTTGFRRALGLVRSLVPGAAVTTDVIAGFPGETDDEFEQTLDFCRQAGFAGVHVFPYSRRSGTLAARMPDQVAVPVRRERTERLLALAAEQSRRFAARFIGREETVLWERPRDLPGGPLWEGLTDTYVRVVARSEQDLRNRLTRARLVAPAEGGGLRGEVPA